MLLVYQVKHVAKTTTLKTAQVPDLVSFVDMNLNIVPHVHRNICNLPTIFHGNTLVIPDQKMVC